MNGSVNDCENNVGRAIHAGVHTHEHDERASISFLETAVPPVEPIKVGASYARKVRVRLYFAFARSAAHKRHRRHRLLFSSPTSGAAVRRGGKRGYRCDCLRGYR